jgi:hypothetical protein
VIDIEKHYNIDRLRPQYKRFAMQPLFILADD